MKQKAIDREMMHDVLADMDFKSPNEKTDFAPKSAVPPKQRNSRNARATVLTVKEIPARGWLPKIGIVGAVLFALVWSGGYFDVGKRLGFSPYSISGSEKSSALPTPVPVAVASATMTAPDDPLTNPKAKTPSADKDAGVPNPVVIHTPQASQQHN